MTPEAIEEAAEILRWLTDDEVAQARAVVCGSIARAAERRAAGQAVTLQTIAWSPVQVAWMWILLTTSPEFLQQQM